MDQQRYDFYKKLRFKAREWLSTRNGKTNKWTEYLMFAPDLFHLLCKLAIDNEVPVKERAKLAATIVYFVSPFDLLPEALLGFVGFADDIALSAYVLNSMLIKCDPEILRRHWAGEQDILELVRKILRMGNKASQSGVLGKGVWSKVRKMSDSLRKSKGERP